MRRIIAIGFAAVAAMAAQAVCAQEAAAPAPTTIVYTNEGMKGMADLPMGVHRIPDSNSVISGHQKGGFLGVLFGPIGMAVQSSSDAARGTAMVKNAEDALRFDAVAKAAELTTAILADERFQQRFTLSADGSRGTLTVTPYIVITLENETDARPYVVLKTRLSTGVPGEKPKALKYFCCQGKAQPLMGENGLTENDGAALKALLTSELETAIRVMLMDRMEPYPRDKEKKISVFGRYAFVGKPFKMKGFDLGHYNEYFLIGFPPGALTFGGVNIAEPGALEILPDEKKKK
jgi:hypothetical protein